MAHSTRTSVYRSKVHCVLYTAKQNLPVHLRKCLRIHADVRYVRYVPVLYAAFDGAVLFLFFYKLTVCQSVTLPYGIAQAVCKSNNFAPVSFFFYLNHLSHTHRRALQYLEYCYLAWRLFWHKPTDCKWETLNLMHKAIILWFKNLREAHNVYIKVCLGIWQRIRSLLANTKQNVSHRLSMSLQHCMYILFYVIHVCNKMSLFYVNVSVCCEQ